MEGRKLADVSEVRQGDGVVVVQIVEDNISVEKVEEIVNNCKTGDCTGDCRCMSESTKQKVELIEVKLIDGRPAIEIKGEVSKEEIEEAISKCNRIVG